MATATQHTAATRPAQQVPAQVPAQQQAPALPSVHMRAFITWLAVFPCITIAQYALGPVLAPYPVPLRVLVITGLVVPFVVYVLVPRLLKIRASLLRLRQR